VFAPDAEAALVKVAVGIGPNGLAYDPGRDLLLAANVGDPERPGSHTVSMVDVGRRALVANVPVPGRTRWTVFDPRREVFFVNISEPAQIIVIDARNPTTIATSYGIPAAGPHGLDLDMAHGRLFCACDAQTLVCLEAHIGEPGVIDVFETITLQRIETVKTERGAHTIAFDADRNKVYAFLPESHRAAVYVDQG
jgi:DNA-binding beta-propeller fold protein YncE